MDRRIGKVLISIDLIQNQPDLVRELTEGMIIVRAEQLFVEGAIEYIAISDHFDEVAEGGTAPNYMAKVTDNEDGTREVSFERWLQ